MAKRIFYSVRVTQGSGERINRGRYKTKGEATKRLLRIKRSSRVDADTKNPRIVKYLGYE